jgi:hypothetical protein
MLFQPDGTTPLWIPYTTFDNQEDCLNYVVANQFGLFAKAIQQYEGRIPPQKISCVPKEDMEELLKPIEQQMNEEKKGV